MCVSGHASHIGLDGGGRWGDGGGGGKSRPTGNKLELRGGGGGVVYDRGVHCTMHSVRGSDFEGNENFSIFKQMIWVLFLSYKMSSKYCKVAV